MAQTQHTNRLIDEASPYLLQHAHNPVDWYPWGVGAFDAARSQNKPIFLSVGYSTCYWCHVMERECFENETIAALMNEHFINIKVDREERPDVDDIYMTAVQLMTHSGGWPMSVFLDSQTLKPFLGGTYFPPEDRYGRAGFPTVLQHIATAWSQQREQITQQADSVANAVADALSERPAEVALRPAHVQQGIASLMRSYDQVNAGFGGEGGPKFPTPVNLDLLIHVAWDKPQVKRAVLHTLDRMAIGGMYDHIGGGFHRYSVDAHWLVPHFEKMLYDNGQLLSTYARAYELTHDPFYKRIVKQTCEYVLREMTDDSGGFFSAQDAEVNHREGENYLWTATEVREALAETGESELATFALEVYGLDRGTNFRDPHHPEDGPKNVIHLNGKPNDIAASRGVELEHLFEQLDHLNKILLEQRTTRDQPGTDDKIITGWNGLMIAGLAEAGRVLGEQRFVDAAHRAATFLLCTLRRDDGGLVRTYRGGKAGSEAFLEDYAFLIQGLLALHHASGDEAMLEQAVSLMNAAKRRFWDESNGGFFNTLADQPDLFVRTKGVHDGAVPAGNSVMALNLIALRHLTGKEHFIDDAVAIIRNVADHIAQRPASVVLSVLALNDLFDEHPEATKPLAGGGEPAQPVRVTVQPEQLTLTAGEEAAFELTLDIAAGYHINAHKPGPAHLEPLSLDDDDNGLEVDVTYPEGDQYEGPIAGNVPARVHTGTVTLPVRVRFVGEIDSPRLTLRYQACTDKACLQPREIVLPIEFSMAT